MIKGVIMKKIKILSIILVLSMVVGVIFSIFTITLFKATISADVKEQPTATVFNADVKEQTTATVFNADVKEQPTATVSNADVKEQSIATISDADVKEQPATMVFNADVKEMSIAMASNADVKELSKAMFQNVLTGEYLNFDYGILQNGTYARVWPMDGSIEQLWVIVKVDGTRYRILTYKSSKYCLDVYRGSSKLKAGQKCDIWKNGADAYAQDFIFYRCDNGNYIIRMAENPDLAIAATSSKGRIKLVKFDPNNECQQWIIKDSKGNKVDVQNESTVSESKTLKLGNALTSDYKTNITTQKWGAYYPGNGYHLGVDLGTQGNKKTNVVAIADGVVDRIVSEKNSKGWGNLVIIKHTTSNGKVFYSGYAHLSSVVVSVGSKVNAGTRLGVMGNTGNSTGPHLHLLVFSGNLAKNSLPKGYVPSKISGNSYKVNGLIYYDPLKVIETQGSIIK